MCITVLIVCTHTCILLLIIIVCKTIQENPKTYQILKDITNQVVETHIVNHLPWTKQNTDSIPLC